MIGKTIKILYVEENIEDVLLIREFIKETKNVNYELTHVQHLDDALLELVNNNYDIIMLDLSLPDRQGVEIITKVRERASHIPVVVMTGIDDETMAIKALQQGAEEYLVKGKVKSHALSRILRYAIMRHKGRTELQSLSLIDNLTGLYNKRGFMLFAQQQLSIAIRTKRGMIVFYIDQDGLKGINDNYGHQCGDLALIETADILKEVFRESDIIGRYGGDEFVAIAIESFMANEEIIRNRIQDELTLRNKQGSRLHKLALSIGTAYYNTEELCSIEELINRAERSMCENKKNRRQS